MGRPPIGKVAMTGAERTRLYRLKRASAEPVTKPVTKQGGPDHAALAGELAQAKARIAELENAKPAQAEIKRHKQKLEYEFEARACQLENAYIERMEKQARASVTVSISDDVQTEVNRWLGVLLPELHKERSKARRAIAKRKRLISKTTFHKLAFVAHPDNGPNATARQRNDAMKVLNALAPFLLDEKDEPTRWDSDLPNDLAGWAKRLQDAELKRRMSDIPARRGMPVPPYLPFP